MASAEITDYHYDALDYSKHGDELAGLGVSENDAYMYATWQFGDDLVLTQEKLLQIADVDKKGLSSINIQFLKNFTANVYNEIFSASALIFAMVAGIVTFLLCLAERSSGSNIEALAFAAQCVAVFAVFFYYQYSGRWSHRIVYAVLLVEFTLLIYVLMIDYETIKTLLIVVIGMMLFATVGQRLENEFAYQEYVRESPEYTALIEYINNHKDTLFVGDVFTCVGRDKYSVFVPRTPGEFDNFVYSGGWSVNSPINEAILNRYGYENPFRALINNTGNVILIDNFYADRKTLYCTEHGDGHEYSCRNYDNVGGYNLYMIE